MKTYHPTQYAYIPEILPTPLRAIGVALGWAVNNGVLVLLVQVTPLAIQKISWRYFMIFIIIDAF